VDEKVVQEVAENKDGDGAMAVVDGRVTGGLCLYCCAETNVWCCQRARVEATAHPCLGLRVLAAFCGGRSLSCPVSGRQCCHSLSDQRPFAGHYGGDPWAIVLLLSHPPWLAWLVSIPAPYVPTVPYRHRALFRMFRSRISHPGTRPLQPHIISHHYIPPHCPPSTRLIVGDTISDFYFYSCCCNHLIS
jgi:hypothetical protein